MDQFLVLRLHHSWTHSAAVPDPHRLYYWRAHGTDGPWTLGPNIQSVPTICAPSCSTCGRPTPHTASVGQLPLDVPVHPNMFCVSPRRLPPFCTCVLAPRCQHWFHRVQLDASVPVHDLPWDTLCAPQLPRLLLPPPPYLRSLPSPTHSDAELVQPTALAFMTHNWGGIALQTALARLWVEALSPDVLCWQELWDKASARAAIPLAYEALWSTADGPGTGFVVAWKRSLRRRPEEAELVFDGEHWIGALLPLWHVGRILVCSVHLHPKIAYKEWIRQVRHMEQLRRDLQPDYSFLSGDLNSTDAPGTPLASSLSPSGALHSYLRVIPTGTPTNHTVVKGTPRATAIDHTFVHGPVAEAHHQLLSSRSTHALIIVTVTLLTRSSDAWAWRRFRWRHATQQDMDVLGAALDLVWGWLALIPAQPDDYVASHHAVATQLIPRPQDTKQLLRRLPQRSFPLDSHMLDQQLTDLREAAEARGYQSHLDVLRSASITAATRAALHLPTPPLEPFNTYCPTLGQ